MTKRRTERFIGPRTGESGLLGVGVLLGEARNLFHALLTTGTLDTVR